MTDRRPPVCYRPFAEPRCVTVDECQSIGECLYQGKKMTEKSEAQTRLEAKGEGIISRCAADVGLRVDRFDWERFSACDQVHVYLAGRPGYAVINFPLVDVEIRRHLVTFSNVAQRKDHPDPRLEGGPVDTVAEITSKRGPIYGPFLHNAIVAQNIKNVMRNLPDPDNQNRFEDLPLDAREALDLIALKMSRILTGDPDYLDNWDDIGGYAKIVADRIRKDKAKCSKTS